MAESNHREIGWADILGFGLSWLFQPPAHTLRNAGAALLHFSQKDTRKSPVAFVLKPLRFAAGEIGREFDRSGRSSFFVTCLRTGSFVLAAVASVAGAAALGYPLAFVAALSMLEMTGAAVLGLGATLFLHRMIMPMMGAAVSLAAGAGRVIGAAPEMFCALREGIRLTTLRRQPPAVARPAGPSPLMKIFDEMAVCMEKESEQERIRFLASMRRKFPAEFADAVRLKPEDPELRKSLVVSKPLKLRRKRNHISGLRS